MSWDWVIALAIIVGFILAIWAKVSQQTIVDLLRDITDYINEQKENATELVYNG